MKKILFILLFVSVFLLNGCATSRGEIELSMPVAGERIPSIGTPVYINSVVSRRAFEQSPMDPSIPSLDSSEVQSGNIKSRAIARKRNTYGKALGDILLKEGQTVERVILHLLTQALTENGFSIIEAKDKITYETNIIDVQINKFWSWMNPGFSEITLTSEISTDISYQNISGVRNESIEVINSDGFMTGSESNWIEVMEGALKEYVIEVKHRFK